MTHSRPARAQRDPTGVDGKEGRDGTRSMEVDGQLKHSSPFGGASSASCSRSSFADLRHARVFVCCRAERSTADQRADVKGRATGEGDQGQWQRNAPARRNAGRERGTGMVADKGGGSIGNRGVRTTPKPARASAEDR